MSLVAKRRKKVFKDFHGFIDWSGNIILTNLMTEGGKGVRSAVVLIVNAYVNWQEEVKAKDNKKHDKENK